MAEAQKTATLRIMKREYQVQRSNTSKRRETRPILALCLEIGLKELGGLGLLQPSIFGLELTNNNRSAVVIFYHLFNERARGVVWCGAVGDDACTHFEIQGDGFAWVERHYLIADLDLHWGTGIVAEVELHL